MKRPFIAFTLVLLASAAGAQTGTVWRCGADGRSYSDAPCAGGQLLDAGDARSDEQRRDAQALAVRERKLADRLRQERIVREQAAPGGHAVIGWRPASRLSDQKPAPLLQAPKKPRLAKHQRPESDDGTFRAAAPGSRRVKG
jgi:hypothetical protein